MTTLEDLVRKIVKRRLQLAGGWCIISVRPLARQVYELLGGEDCAFTLPQLYKMIDNILFALGGREWDTSSSRRKSRRGKRALPTKKKYIFKEVIK